MLMTYQLIRFHFRTPLHIGTVREDYASSESVLHSDSLYSAILSAWAALGLAIPKNLQEQPEQLGFTLSSLFPFYQPDETSAVTYFFPKPLGTMLPQSYAENKPLKKIRYLDGASFQKILADGITFRPNPDNIEEAFYFDKTADKKAFDTKKFRDSEVFARNRVPRIPKKNEKDEDTQIYYTERVSFKGNSGLFCLVKFEDEATKNKVKNNVKTALDYLQDEGIGTDRHVGNGLFEWEMDDIELTAEKSDYAVNLSLFCPENPTVLGNMLQGNIPKYELLKRGGWITTEPYLTYRKKSIYMFQEGGIFRTDEKSKGKIVDLKPDQDELPKESKIIDHPIYRVGKSLFIPIHLKSEKNASK